MKTPITAFLTALTVCVSVSAAPFLAVGDGAEIFLTGTLGLRADDNIFLNVNKIDDVIIDIKPGIELLFGSGSATKGRFHIVESIARYSDNDNLDTELLSVGFDSRYANGKSKLNVAVNYAQLNQNNYDVQNLARRDVFDASLNGEVSLTGKTSVGIGGGYSRTDYELGSYSDLTVFNLPVNYYYELSPKLDLSLGFRFRDTQAQLGTDSKDYAYRVGFRGDFSPKVHGNLQVGFGSRKLSTGGKENMLNMEGDLDFLLTAKSTLRVLVSNDFGDTAFGGQTKSFFLGGMLTNRASAQWATHASLHYRKLDYYSRTDDFVEFQLGADYAVTANVSLTGAYAYRNYESDTATRKFRNSVFSFGANFRY